MSEKVLSLPMSAYLVRVSIVFLESKEAFSFFRTHEIIRRKIGFEETTVPAS